MNDALTSFHRRHIPSLISLHKQCVCWSKSGSLFCCCMWSHNCYIFPHWSFHFKLKWTVLHLMELLYFSLQCRHTIEGSRGRLAPDNLRKRNCRHESMPNMWRLTKKMLIKNRRTPAQPHLTYHLLRFQKTQNRQKQTKHEFRINLSSLTIKMYLWQQKHTHEWINFHIMSFIWKQFHLPTTTLSAAQSITDQRTHICFHYHCLSKHK